MGRKQSFKRTKEAKSIDRTVSRKNLAVKEKMYRDLLNMPDSQRESELQTIKAKRQSIKRRLDAQGRGDASAELEREDKALEKEEARLEAFPKVKEQIKKIMTIRTKMRMKKQEKMSELEAEVKPVYDEIADFESKREEDSKRRESIKAIDEEMAKIEEYAASVKEMDLDELATQKDKIDEYSRRRAELKTQKGELEGQLIDIDGEIKKLKESIAPTQKQLDTYKAGKSKEDLIINKCDLAWTMLLDGKSWDDIVLKPSEELAHGKAQKTETKKPEANGRNTSAGKDQNAGVLGQNGTGPSIYDIHKMVKQDEGKEDGELTEEEEEAARKKMQAMIKLDQQRFENKNKVTGVIARIPLLGKMICKIADRNIDKQAKAIAEGKEIQAGNGMRVSGKLSKEEVDALIAQRRKAAGERDAEQIKSEVLQRSNKKQRDMFMEYLRESVTGEGHTESGKYASKQTEKGAEEKEEETR